MGIFLPNYRGEGPTTISEECGFHQVHLLDQGLEMVLLVTMHEPVGLTPLVRKYTHKCIGTIIRNYVTARDVLLLLLL